MKASRQSMICLVGLAGTIGIVALARSETTTPMSPQEQQILAQLRQEHGFVPKALQVMTHRSGTLPHFMVYGKGVFEGGPLGEKGRSRRRP